MTTAYHNQPPKRTAFVPSLNGTEAGQTPAADGFHIQARHRTRTGDIHWRLIWLDFAAFLGVQESEIRKLEPFYRRRALADAAAAKGYDPICVEALDNASKRTSAVRAARALGFKPIYLWPATARKRPAHYQRLDTPTGTTSNVSSPEPSWLALVDGPTDKDGQDESAASPMAKTIASAEAFAVAIDCLPVGKDIRNRLQAHVQAHIDLLRRCESADQ